MLRITILIILLIGGLSLKPPTPYCRTSPLPSKLPISVGQKVSINLENLFLGYNIQFKGASSQHISIAPKEVFNERKLQHSMNFTSARIKDNNRFLGVITTDNSTTLAVGLNHQQSGVEILKEIFIQDQPHLRCFDVDQAIIQEGKLLAVIDCGYFNEASGHLLFNMFLYVDLTTYKIFLGSHISDTFVDYKQIHKRSIQVVVDPRHRTQYLIRVLLRDGVDIEHQDQTYAQIFLMNNVLKPQLLDVIDHTFVNRDAMSIAGYQYHLGYLYLLNYNNGLYQLRMTPQQRIQIKSYMAVGLDADRFHIDQLGFSDDLNVVVTNSRTVYQYEWDVIGLPVLTNKYSLMPYGRVYQIFVDYNFVVVNSLNSIDGMPHRKIWIFSKNTQSYMNAFQVYEAPQGALLDWQEHGSTLHVFSLQTTFNVKLGLPYLNIEPVLADMAGRTEQYLIIANSSEGDKYLTCQQKLQIIYQDSDDRSIIKTGFGQRNATYVDSPDVLSINLRNQFFGPDLQYQVIFESNSSIFPQVYNDKQHQASIEWPKQIDPSKIIYFQMFTELSRDERYPTSIYGLVQTQQNNQHPVHYVHCSVQVLSHDDKHHLNCRIVYKQPLSLDGGKILKLSQMFNPWERRIAVIFQKQPHSIVIFYLFPDQFYPYGKITYDGHYQQDVAAMSINNGQLFVVFDIGKRVDIYDLYQIHSNIFTNPPPIFKLDKDVMKFFGVVYFAPTDITVSPYHKQQIFLKTKTGVVVLNINSQGFPNMIFQLETSTSQFDFEVSDDTIMIITGQTASFYRLRVPLRRNDPPFLLQKLKGKYSLKQYEEVVCDQLFYTVSDKIIGVLNPDMPSTSIQFTHFYSNDSIINIDAVSISDKQVLFVHSANNIKVLVYTTNPKMFVSWYANSPDFKLNLTAKNNKTKSDVYSMLFQVLPSAETEILPTDKFDTDFIKKLGHIKTEDNNETTNYNLSISDSEWFYGNVLHYSISCDQCHKTIFLQNHIHQSRDILDLRAIYDLEASSQGIFAQMYQFIAKTNRHNDSLQSIVTIPRGQRGQVCTKLATSNGFDFVISLCQTGVQVNMYVTTYNSYKPFTWGPFRSDAKAANYAQMSEDVLILVDNDDNPYVRAGGVYLYVLRLHLQDKTIQFLDYIDVQDLQLEGYSDFPYIASATIHKPVINEEHFRLFMTDARTGDIFVFTFQISDDRQQAIYLSQKRVQLNKLIPSEVHHPSPLKVHGIKVLNYFYKSQDSIQYTLLLTVSNWHHLQVALTLDHEDNILFFQLERLFERFPWTLGNYLKKRTGMVEANYFAVPYIDYEKGRQIIVVYPIPNKATSSQDDKENIIHVPITKGMGAHLVRDTNEVCFQFSVFDRHKLFFVDIDGQNVTELLLNQNLTLQMIDYPRNSVQNVQFKAENGFKSLDFQIQVKLTSEQEEVKQQIIWAVIMVIGLIMIIVLIVVAVRQSKKKHIENEMKQSLITIDDQFKNAYINRSSVDPQSQRNTMDLRQQPTQETAQFKKQPAHQQTEEIIESQTPNIEAKNILSQEKNIQPSE